MKLRTFIPVLIGVVFLSMACQPGSQNAERQYPMNDEIKARITMLEDQRNPDMEVFADYLKSENKNVRLRACLALGRIGMLDKEDPFRKDLENLVLEDKEIEVRAMAAFALGLARENKSITVLSKALKDDEPLVRQRAAEAICLVGQASDAKLVKLPLVNDEDIQVRRQILRSSWRLRDEALTEEVMNIIREGQEDLLWDATYHMTRSGLAQAQDWTPELMETLVKNEDPQIRKNAIKLLPNLQDREKLSSLFDLLLQDADNNVRINAMRVASTLGYPKLLDVLPEMVESESPQVRQEAVKAAGAMIRLYKEAGSEEAELYQALANVALKGLEDKEADIVAEAVKSLLPVTDIAGIQDKQDALLADERPRVRAAAVNMIIFTDPEGKQVWPRLEKALSDKESGVRLAAIQLLMRLNDEKVPERLIEILKGEDPIMVSIAASFFQRTPLADALDPLVESFKVHENDEDLEALSGIVAALGSYQGSELATETLKKALDNKARKIRLAAATILENVVENAMDKVGKEETGRDLEFYQNALKTVRENPVLRLKTTKGDLVMRFYSERATLTAYNIITLAQKGYFDGTTIHRVVPDFVAQMGDPMGTGWGGPGYSIRCEVNDLDYERGAVGMALSGKDTGGSQFFFTISAQPHLDGGYTIFAETIEGIEIAEQLLPGDKIIKAELEGE